MISDLQVLDLRLVAKYTNTNCVRYYKRKTPKISPQGLLLITFYSLLNYLVTFSGVSMIWSTKP